MAAGVNPVDAKFCWGDKLPQYEIFDGLAQRGVDGNVVGFDYAGVVVEAGTGSKFKKGDEVFGILPPMRGSYAQFVLAPEAGVALKPKELSFVEASALPLVGTTCTQMFNQHNLVAGQSLLVIGASGGVGHMASAIAHKKGVKVTAVCGSRNLKFVEGLAGEGNVYPYDGKTPVIDSLIKYSHEKQLKYDMVLDTVTSNEARDTTTDYYTLI